jgi:hypothetical protein
VHLPPAASLALLMALLAVKAKMSKAVVGEEHERADLARGDLLVDPPTFTDITLSSKVHPSRSYGLL